MIKLTTQQALRGGGSVDVVVTGENPAIVARVFRVVRENLNPLKPTPKFTQEDVDLVEAIDVRATLLADEPAATVFKAHAEDLARRLREML